MISKEHFELLIDSLKKDDNLPTRIANILKEKTYKDEQDFYETYENLLLEYTSYYLFPYRLIAFYPQVIERSSKKN